MYLLNDRISDFNALSLFHVKRVWNIEIVHAFSNQVADFMANLYINMQSRLVVFDDTPIENLR